MGKNWRQEKSNHHFPELNQKNKVMVLVRSIAKPWRLGVFAVSLTLAVGFFYLTQTSSSATQGYQIKDLEGRIEDLQRVNKKLNLEYTEMQSIANLTERLNDLDLVTADNIEVINMMGSTVAKR